MGIPLLSQLPLGGHRPSLTTSHTSRHTPPLVHWRDSPPTLETNHQWTYISTKLRLVITTRPVEPVAPGPARQHPSTRPATPGHPQPGRCYWLFHLVSRETAGMELGHSCCPPICLHYFHYFQYLLKVQNQLTQLKPTPSPLPLAPLITK